MKDMRDLLKQYLAQVNIMQLATVVDNQPWACTVHYYADEDLNFYWVSKPETKHSEQIKLNSKVAVAVMVHENTPAEDYVIGISVEGTAKLVSELDNRIGEGYVRKHNEDLSLLSNIASGKSPFRFYHLKPSRIVLFNNKDFPDSPRQELKFS